jgi:hypothetical protein
VNGVNEKLEGMSLKSSMCRKPAGLWNETCRRGYWRAMERTEKMMEME